MLAMTVHKLYAVGTFLKTSLTKRYQANEIIQYLFYSSSSSRFDDEDINVKPSKLAKHRITTPFDMFAKKKQEDDANLKLKSRRKSLKQRVVTKKPKIRGQLIYGKFPVVTALQAHKRKIYQIYVKSNLVEGNEKTSTDITDDILNLATDHNIPVEAVSKDFLNLLVDDPMQGLRQHQVTVVKNKFVEGVCADVSPLHYTELDLTDTRSFAEHVGYKPKIWLVIQSVQDPNNFGAVLRSAYYLGVDRIVGYNSCKLSPAVSKVSAGVLEVIDVYRTKDLPQLLQVCHAHKWQIFGTTGLSAEREGVVSLPDVRVERNTIVIIGNEGCGLSHDVISLCDKMITIPSRQKGQLKLAFGMLDSLNVSVASGIIVHHLINNRTRS